MWRDAHGAAVLTELEFEYVKAALSTFGDGMTAMHLGPHFTCGEAETVAAAMQAIGLESEHIDTWIEGHALGDDDPDDIHYKGEES